MLDSTNAEERGSAPSEKSVGVVLRQLFAEHKTQRIITASFASHIHRVLQIAEAAIDAGRVVAPLGRSMINNVRMARDLGIINLPDRSIIDVEDIDDYAPEQICVISTGSQGEPMAALSLLALIGTLGFVGRDLLTRAAPPALTKEVLGFYGFSTTVIAGACYAIWDGKAFVALESFQIVMISAALFAGVFAYTALMSAMRTGSIAAVTPYRYTRLLFGISIGVLAFEEKLDAPMILGCAVVICAGLFVGWQNQRRQPAQ
jgi:uncharacterized membrane protein